MREYATIRVWIKNHRDEVIEFIEDRFDLSVEPKNIFFAASRGEHLYAQIFSYIDLQILEWADEMMSEET